VRGFKGTTALSALVNALVREHSMDYVFYDCGPNIGPLNRIVLLDCDDFMIPSACDLFSLRAIKTLGHTLCGWIEEWNIITELAPEGIYLLPGRPRFLGYVPQRFKVYGGALSMQYAAFLPKIEKTILSDVVQVLRRIDPSLVTKHGVKLGEVKDFASIANASQVKGVAMWQTTAGTCAQREEARDAFMRLASELDRRASEPPQ
jgi:hypothetical protein